MPQQPQDLSGYWHVYCDGSASPNPGSMGIGVVAHTPSGEVLSVSRRLPGSGCNNEAELLAARAALALGLAHGATHICLYTDSDVVYTQCATVGARPVARLISLVAEILALAQDVVHLRWVWVPRHRNGPADALARQALGMAPKPKRRK